MAHPTVDTQVHRQHTVQAGWSGPSRLAHGDSALHANYPPMALLVPSLVHTKTCFLVTYVCLRSPSLRYAKSNLSVIL